MLRELNKRFRLVLKVVQGTADKSVQRKTLCAVNNTSAIACCTTRWYTTLCLLSHARLAHVMHAMPCQVRHDTLPLGCFSMLCFACYAIQHRHATVLSDLSAEIVIAEQMRLSLKPELDPFHAVPQGI